MIREMTGLTQLELHYRSIAADSWLLLWNTLSELPSLQRLRIQADPYANTRCTTAIAKPLSKMQQLTHLSLPGRSKDKEEDDFLLCATFAQLTQLCWLEWNWPMSETSLDSAERLLQTLSALPALTYLDLRYSHVEWTWLDNQPVYWHLAHCTGELKVGPTRALISLERILQPHYIHLGDYPLFVAPQMDIGWPIALFR